MILKVWLRNRDIGPENDKGDRQLDHISPNHLNPAGHAMIEVCSRPQRHYQ
jgi:hypothetical protein